MAGTTITVTGTDIYQSQSFTASGATQTLMSRTLMSWFYWPASHANTLALLGQGWDYVVLIDDPYVASQYPEYSFEGVNAIANQVRQAGSQPLLVMTWSSNSSTTIDAFEGMTYRVGNGTGVPVVPAGYAWTSLNSALTGTGTRPNLQGAYLTAASVYSEIFNRSASGSSYVPVGLAQADRDSIATAALTSVQTGWAINHYTGRYVGATHFISPAVSSRTLNYTDWNSSTEWGYRAGLSTVFGNCRVNMIGTYAGYQSYMTSGFPYDFCQSRFYWDADTTQWTNFGTFDYQDDNGATSMVAGVDRVLYYAPLPEQETTATNVTWWNTDSYYMDQGEFYVPIRVLWSRLATAHPEIPCQPDGHHLSEQYNQGVATMMYALLSGRCGVGDQPPNLTGTDSNWQNWYCRKTGYEIAWQYATLQYRVPGFEVLPASINATQVSPGSPTTLTARFLYPPASNVIVNVSVDNSTAAIVTPSMLTFSPQNYNITQTVTVTAAPLVAIPQTFNVSFSTASSDAVYDGLSDQWGYNPTAAIPPAATWIVDASGFWSAPGNWWGGTPPAGSGVTAYLNLADITADRTIHLDGTVTLGNLLFGDTVLSSGAGWTLDNNGNAGNVPTLDGSTPTISVYALGAGKAATVSAVLSGTEGLTKSGVGILALGGANIYTGTTTLAAGTLQANNASALGNGSIITFGGGALQFTSLSSGQDWSARFKGSPSAIVLDTNGQSVILAGAIDNSNTGGLTKVGAGTLTLSGANAYNGPTIATGGILLTSNAAALPGYSTPGNVSFNGGTVAAQIGGGGWSTAQVDTLLSNATKTSGALGIDTSNGSLTQWTAFTTSNFGGALGLTKTGVNTLTLNQANTYTGATLVSGGTLVLANNLALQNSIIDTSGTGAIVLSATAPVFGGLSGSTNLASAFAAGYGSVTALGLNPGVGATDAYSGNIANGAAGMTITKSGTGTQILSGSNTYSGATRVSGGMLQFAKVAALYGGTTASWTAANLAVGSGAMLAFNVGGTNEFTTANVTTLLTNLAASTSATSNGMAAGSILAFDTTNASGNSFTISNVIADTTGAAGGTRGLTKLGVNTLVLTGANTYTGPTTITAGTLTLSGANGVLALSATPISLAGGLLKVGDGSGSAGTNNNNRIADSQAINLSGGSFALLGSAIASTPTSEAVGAFSQGPGADSISVTYAGSTAATTLTAASFNHSTGNAATLVNGASLGKDSTSTASVARFILTTPPTLVGTTAALSTGINSAAKNTQIVPYLLGEATSTTGGLGTATGIASTFLTYNATTGLRPLNLTDEFTKNAYTSGNNTWFTTGTTLAGSMAINSLVMGAGGSANIADGQTLTVTSGAVLFSGSAAIQPAGSTGVLAFGSAEAMVTVNGGNIGSIGTPITGSGGLVKSGMGRLTLSGSNSYSGITAIDAGVLSISRTASLPGWGTVGMYTVACGVTLAVGNAVSDVNVATMLGSGNFAPGSSLGFDTASGDRAINPAFIGTAGLLKLGANTLTLGAAGTLGSAVLDGAGGLALSDNVTASSLNLQNLTGASTTTGTVGIAFGKTLTVNGPVRAGNNGTGYANTFSIGGASNGLGTLAVNSAISDFSVGDTAQTAAAVETLDMSALGMFTATLRRLKVGYGENSVDRGILRLANTNMVTASSFEIGSAITGGATYGRLELGASNTFNVDAINVGSGYQGSGGITFASALSSGAVTIRKSAGGSSAAVLNESMGASSSGNYCNQVDFTGGVLDAKFGTSTVGQDAGNQNVHSSILTIGQTSGAGADFSSGTLTIGRWNGSSTTAHTQIPGMVYIGTTTGTAIMTAGAIKLADNSAATNVSNLASDTYVSGILTIGQCASATATSIMLGQSGTGIAVTNAAVNLNKGGTLTIGAGGLYTARYTGANPAASTLSFDGGVLKASSAGSLVGSGSGALASVTLLAGGATIDSNGNDVSIDQPITAGVGNGLSGIAVTGNGTVAYVVAPYVQITDSTGSGASAFAKINSAGYVTSIVVTNAGQNYTNPTITLLGGAGATASGSATLGSETGGGLNKVGAGTLTLNAANTYTGPTTVYAGTLSIAIPFLSSTANVNLAGGMLNLAFSGADTIAALFINGVRQPSGAWGAIGSGATNTTALITGSGLLNVTTGPFELWIAGYPSLSGSNRTVTANPAGDGLTNLQKYILGLDPTVFTTTGSGANGLNVTKDSLGNIVLSFNAYAASGTGYTGLTRYYTVQTNTDITSYSGWQPLCGYTNIVGANQTVTITLPAGDPRRFYRLGISVQ